MENSCWVNNTQSKEDDNILLNSLQAMGREFSGPLEETLLTGLFKRFLLGKRFIELKIQR
jgi:hypothetical protein